MDRALASRTAHASFTGLLVTVLWPHLVSAQLVPHEPETGFLDPRPVFGGEVFQRCVTAVTASYGENRELACTVVDSIAVDPGEPPTWMLKYERQAVITDGEYADTITIDELALVREVSRGSEYELLWHLLRNQTEEFLSLVEFAPREEGTLVGYLVCLNGTGGCAQHFLLGRADWIVVSQSYLESLAGLVPEGWRLHKGRMIDLETLEGVQPLAAPRDANCCPSGRMTFRVELREGDLRLAGAEVTAPRG